MKNILIVSFVSFCSIVLASTASKSMTIMKTATHSIAMRSVVIQNTLKDTTITVYGNCTSCKKAIEKAAKSVAGVESASWDKKKKTLNVLFDTSETSLNLIEKAIIQIGYDTEHMRAEDSVYNDLHHCCKYDRKPQ